MYHTIHLFKGKFNDLGDFHRATGPSQFNFATFSSPQKETYPLTVTPYSFACSVLGNHLPIFCLYRYFFLSL